MDRLTSFVDDLLSFAGGLVAALLPRPENERLGHAWEVDVAPFSMGLGLVEAVVGGLGFLFGGIAAMTGDIELLNRLLVENWFPGLSTTHFQGAGLVALLIWCTHPLAWLLALCGITGMVRVFTFVTTREAVGEPLVWLALRLVQAVRRSSTAAARLRRLGALRRDRLVWGRDGALVILTCRDRPDWSDSVTLELDGRFFRLVDASDRVEGAHLVVAYRFAELGEHGVVRCPLAYRDTGEVAPAATRGSTACRA